MAVTINGAAWLLKACHHHHAHVTSAHGAALAHARATGWLLTEGQDAERVPVHTRHWSDPIYLMPDGCWSMQPPPED